MKIENYKPKYSSENYNLLEVFDSRSHKTLIELLDYKVVLDGNVKSVKEVLEYIYIDLIRYSTEKDNELLKRIEELEKKLETQQKINKNLLEAFKDGGVI